MYPTDRFKENLIEFGIQLNENQINQLLKYYELLVEWNGFMNLTAITDYDEVLKKHFMDSLSLIKVFDVHQDVSVIDVGTGAGFPGLVLKIAYPNLKITLLDSLNKRVQFLNEVIKQLDLKGIETIHGRAEDFAKAGMLREKFDLCVSRAVANLSTLTEYCLPYVKLGGEFISYKAEKTEQELESAKKAIMILGGKFDRSAEFYLPDSDIYRNLIVIKKVKETPKKFPRKAGLPSKEPIS